MRISPIAAISLAMLASRTTAFTQTTIPKVFGSTQFTTSLNMSTETPILTITPPFAAVRDTVITQLTTSGKVPPQMIPSLSHFVSEYAMACSENGSVTPETCAENIATCTRVALENGLPGPTQYKFENSAHQAIRKPFDYYQFGVDFFRPAMDLENSVVLGTENFEEAFEFMKKGENVVFLANHQSEADPQVFSILLEKIGRRREAEELVYVAGHKVTTDPLAIPFSMGRNLLCIHSKKHINVDPTTKESKTQQNVATMNQMLKMMRGGGVGIWVAPSGGRDRRDVDTCEVPVAPFDQKTIDMFRLMGSKSKTPTHFYSLAMVSYELCPPPDTVEAGVGEQRNIRYTPIGIACGEELPNVGGKESRHLFAQSAMEICEEKYFETMKEIEVLVKNSEKQ
mmetsp:Transcript_15378/g.17697  ORF Transcript_15378/g.17697 Transcript_15378/m.17697 type:complete len:398 (-) Transcript_15378:229-1422(-)